MAAVHCVGIYYFTIWSMQGHSLDTVDLNECRKPSDWRPLP